MVPIPTRVARPRPSRGGLVALVAGAVLLAGAWRPDRPRPPWARARSWARAASPRSRSRPTSVTSGACATGLPELSPQQMAQVYIDEGIAAGVRRRRLRPGRARDGLVRVPRLAPAERGPGAATRVDNLARVRAAGRPQLRRDRGLPGQHGVHAHADAPAGCASPDPASPQLRRRRLALLEPRDAVPAPGYDATAFDTFPLKGRAPRWIDLDGRWAVPGTTYGQTVLSISNTMRAFNGLAPVSASSVSASSLLTTHELQATTTFRH